MPIEFNNIPSNIATRFASFEIGAARSTAVVERTLLIVQKTGDGTGEVDTVYEIASVQDAITLCGEGSIGHLMVAAYFANNQTGLLDIVIVEDLAGGTAGIKRIAYTGTATAAGSIYLETAGQAVTVPVAVGDTAADVAAATEAALTAKFGLPYTAAQLGGGDTDKVALTARHKGVAADWDTIVNPKGLAGGQSLPAGITVALSTPTPGAGDPTDLAAAITALGDTPYRYVVCPYWTGDALTAVLSELEDRWDYDRQIRGVAITAKRGTASAVASAASAFNDPNLTMLAIPAGTSPIYAYASAFAGAAAKNLLANPARSLSTVEIKGVAPIPRASLYTVANKQTLHTSGAATLARLPGQRYDHIDVPRTTYRLDGGGAPSLVWARLERRIVTARTPERVGAALANNFERALVTEDQQPVAAGLTVATPSTVKSVVVSEFEAMALEGWYTGLTEFEAGIVCEVNADNAARIDIAMSPTLTAQLETIAAKMTMGV